MPEPAPLFPRGPRPPPQVRSLHGTALRKYSLLYSGSHFVRHPGQRDVVMPVSRVVRELEATVAPAEGTLVDRRSGFCNTPSLLYMFLTVLFTHSKKRTTIANIGRLWFSLLAPGGSVMPETPCVGLGHQEPVRPSPPRAGPGYETRWASLFSR